MPLSKSSDSYNYQTNRFSRLNPVESSTGQGRVVESCFGKSGVTTAAFFFAVAAAFVGIASSAHSQNQNRPVDKVRAQLEEVFGNGESEESEVSEKPNEEQEEGALKAKDYTPFGVDIGAIILHPDQDKADKKKPDLPDEKIVIDPEIDQPENLVDGVLTKYIGKPVSAGLLSDLAKDIILAWRTNDHPLVDVYFPEQNITKGKLQIVVKEALLGSIEVKNAKRSREAYLKRQIGVDPGDRINQRTIKAGLEWLNENPVRNVNLIYDRGEADGTSDVILQLDEKKSVSLYSSFANTGLNLTGENEFSAGFNLSNPFKTEQTFGYNYNSDIDFETLEAHTAFYQAYLPWRHKFRLVGAYVTSEAVAGGDAFPIDLMGENIQGTGDYEIPLPRPRKLDGLRHSIIFGADYKSTNTNLIFGGEDIFDSKAAVVQFRAEYDATLRDNLGYTRINLSSVWAPGSVLQYNDDEAFEALREVSSADYWYGIAELERGFKLPANFSLVLRGTGQYTDSRLISTEQLLAGGYRSVRGFDENLIRGDSGVILNAELISPEFSLLPFVKDQWNLLGFYDAAAMHVTELEADPDAEATDTPIASNPNPSLQSYGVGLRLRIHENVFARAAYGWVLDTHALDEALIKDGKLHFGVTVRY